MGQLSGQPLLNWRGGGRHPWCGCPHRCPEHTQCVHLAYLRGGSDRIPPPLKCTMGGSPNALKILSVFLRLTLALSACLRSWTILL